MTDELDVFNSISYSFYCVCLVLDGIGILWAFGPTALSKVTRVIIAWSDDMIKWLSSWFTIWIRKVLVPGFLQLEF